MPLGKERQRVRRVRAVLERVERSSRARFPARLAVVRVRRCDRPRHACVNAHLDPRDNGELHLRVTLLNRQMTDVDFTVLSADSDVPALLSTEFDDDCIHLTVQDASGLDCDAITAIGEDGEITSPLRCDADSGRITLPYPQKTICVRIPDMRGNTLEVLLRP